MSRGSHSTSTPRSVSVRLTRKSYGQVFLDSLSPFPLTRDVGEVQAFFDAETPGDDAPT